MPGATLTATKTIKFTYITMASIPVVSFYNTFAVLAERENGLQTAMTSTHDMSDGAMMCFLSYILLYS